MLKISLVCSWGDIHSMVCTQYISAVMVCAWESADSGNRTQVLPLIGTVSNLWHVTYWSLFLVPPSRGWRCERVDLNWNCSALTFQDSVMKLDVLLWLTACASLFISVFDRREKTERFPPPPTSFIQLSNTINSN